MLSNCWIQCTTVTRNIYFVHLFMIGIPRYNEQLASIVLLLMYSSKHNWFIFPNKKIKVYSQVYPRMVLTPCGIVRNSYSCSRHVNWWQQQHLCSCYIESTGPQRQDDVMTWERFSALQALCKGNPMDFPHDGRLCRTSWYLLPVSVNKLLNKQSSCRSFETSSWLMRLHFKAWNTRFNEKQFPSGVISIQPISLWVNKTHMVSNQNCYNIIQCPNKILRTSNVQQKEKKQLESRF